MSARTPNAAQPPSLRAYGMVKIPHPSKMFTQLYSASDAVLSGSLDSGISTAGSAPAPAQNGLCSWQNDS